MSLISYARQSITIPSFACSKEGGKIKIKELTNVDCKLRYYYLKFGHLSCMEFSPGNATDTCKSWELEKSAIGENRMFDLRTSFYASMDFKKEKD